LIDLASDPNHLFARAPPKTYVNQLGFPAWLEVHPKLAFRFAKGCLTMHPTNDCHPYHNFEHPYLAGS